MSDPTAVNFVVHDGTGKILASGTCPVRDLALQATGWADGAVVVKADAFYLPDKHYVAAGVILPRARK